MHIAIAGNFSVVWAYFSVYTYVYTTSETNKDKLDIGLACMEELRWIFCIIEERQSL